MDPRRFDALTVRLSTNPSRRGLLAAFGATLLGLGGATGAAAKGRCKSPDVRCGKGKNATCCKAPALGTGTVNCTGGQCVVSCEPGYINCAGACVTSGTGTTNENCGPCGQNCTQIADTECGQTDTDDYRCCLPLGYGPCHERDLPCCGYPENCGGNFPIIACSGDDAIGCTNQCPS